MCVVQDYKRELRQFIAAVAASNPHICSAVTSDVDAAAIFRNAVFPPESKPSATARIDAFRIDAAGPFDIAWFTNKIPKLNFRTKFALSWIAARRIGFGVERALAAVRFEFGLIRLARVEGIETLRAIRAGFRRTALATVGDSPLEGTSHEFKTPRVSRGN